jgi:hypothetical protein
VYGLPHRPLTYEEEVVLDLCMPRACKRLAKIAVEAHQIARGAVPDEEWFAMDAESEAAGRAAYYDAVLAQKVAQYAARR